MMKKYKFTYDGKEILKARGLKYEERHVTTSHGTSFIYEFSFSKPARLLPTKDLTSDGRFRVYRGCVLNSAQLISLRSTPGKVIFTSEGLPGMSESRIVKFTIVHKWE